MKKQNYEWEKILRLAEKYCEVQNGNAECKNCGLDFELIIKLVKSDIKQAIDEAYNEGMARARNARVGLMIDTDYEYRKQLYKKYFKNTSYWIYGE